MGYDTKWDGEFTLNRDLTVKVFRELEGGAYWPWFPRQDGEAFYGREGSCTPASGVYNLKELIQRLSAEGYVFNGEVEWVGEQLPDLGKIVVTDNVIEVFDGKIVYEKRAPEPEYEVFPAKVRVRKKP